MSSCLSCVTGNRNIWDYWFKSFTPQYENLPGLGPLEVIYNKPDPLMVSTTAQFTHLMAVHEYILCS